jgi:ribonuclease HIII
MAHDTLVLKLDRAEQEKLARDVRAGAFELKPVEHARFSARGEGVTATLYSSGKLVVQGAGAALFVERFVGRPGNGAGARPGARGLAAEQAADRAGGALIGGDESGKGDYFGPLVVAAVRIGPGDAAKLAAGGVMDSKKVADATALRLGAALRGHFPCALRVLDPPEYTRRQAAHGNVALLLAELYREVVEELVKPGQPGCTVLIDQFSKSADRLKRVFRGLDVTLYQEHEAERAPAVAAASLVARAAFLDGLRELGDEVGMRLPKGAGPPVLAAARELIALHGPGILDRVAKVHFKTTQRLRP